MPFFLFIYLFLVLFDIRKRQILESMKGHGMNVKCLALSPHEDFVVSGSSDGNVKVWGLVSPFSSLKPSSAGTGNNNSSVHMQLLHSWEDMHEKQTFVRKPGVFQAPVSTFGVMQVMLTTTHLYTCGSDGRLMRTNYTGSFTGASS